MMTPARNSKCKSLALGRLLRGPQARRQKGFWLMDDSLSRVNHGSSLKLAQQGLRNLGRFAYTSRLRFRGPSAGRWQAHRSSGDGIGSMQIVLFPHPALRFPSVDVQRIDDALRATIQRMFDLMYESKGVGLAANQVGLPFRFFIVNPSGDPEKKDEEQVFIK